jgi:hypothetical protein
VRGRDCKAKGNIAMRGRGCKAEENIEQRLFGSKEIKHGKQATINRFRAKKVAAPHVDQKRTLLIMPFGMQTGCRSWQNLNSTPL